MRYLPFMVLILMVMALPALGASSFVGGFSGSILTPDGIVLPQGSWDWSFHQFTDFFLDEDLTSFGVTYGLVENLEVGASFISNGDSETALNAKYRLLPETATRPTIIVGVFDIAGTVEDLDDDPGLYLLFSKNITPVASEIAGEPSRPLRLTLGFGTGFFDGVFAGLDWTLQENLSAMLEFSSSDVAGNDSDINVGIRFAAADALRLDAALIDWDDFAFGANYRIAF